MSDSGESGNDRYLPGTLNPVAVRVPGNHVEGFSPSTDGTNFFAQARGVLQGASSINTYEGITQYKAMVIGEVKTTSSGGFLGIGGSKRYEFKVRIPELHSSIPDPCGVPPDATKAEAKIRKMVAAHPTAYSATDAENGTPLPEPAMGDIVWVQFEKGPSAGNMTTPIYTAHCSKGSGTNNISDVCQDLADMVNSDNAGGTVGGNHANVGGYGGDPNSWPSSETSEHIEGGAAATLHDTASAYYEELGYTWYTEPFMLNLMGLRNTNTRSNNSFDDKLICMYTDDEGTQHVYVWPGTTRPGRTAMMDGRASIAIMVPSAPQYHANPAPERGGRPSSAGQKTYYKGAPSNGKVRGRNSDGGVGYAGVGPDPVQSYRDSNNDDVFNYDPASIGGCQQCQIHGTSPNMGSGVASRVGGTKADGSAWAWSEGCQVWGAWPDYTFWLSLWGQQIQRGRDYIDYVLIRAEDSPELWQTSTASEEPSAGDAVE